MKNQEILKLFEFVVQEVDRLKALIRTNRDQALKEIGLNRGLPCNYDEFCKDFFQCGTEASRRLYAMARSKLEQNPRLKNRVSIGAFLGPILVELAQRAVAKRTTIDEALMKAIFREAELHALHQMEDRTYFFPVYAISELQLEEYTFGPVRFLRTHRFLAENEERLKRAQTDSLHDALAADPSSDGDFHTARISQLYNLARDHYRGYRWIASLDVKGAAPDIGWAKARETLEQTLGLLRLSVESQESGFVGLVEESPFLRSASQISLTARDTLDVSCSSSYREPSVVAGFIDDFRQQVPSIANLETALGKMHRWEELDAIEDRLLTALFWFNEGWKESRAQPKIVKFSTCVECLFSTSGDHEAIAEKSSERLAWLAFPGPSEWEDRRKIYGTMKAVYGARSKAVHGDNAVKDLDLQLLAHQAERQARLAIFAFSQLPPLFRDKQDQARLLNELCPFGKGASAQKSGGIVGGTGISCARVTGGVSQGARGACSRSAF